MGTKVCVKCKLTLPKTEEYFFYRLKASGYFSSWCKKCRTEHRKANHSKEMAWQRERRKLNKETPKCRDCSTTDIELGHRLCISCKVRIKKDTKRRWKVLYKDRLKKAMPKWANTFFIMEIYDLARLRTLLTGIEWHVDHKIPIKGKNVCGLHVENNLDVILGKDNLLKSNTFIGEQYDITTTKI